MAVNLETIRAVATDLVDEQYDDVKVVGVRGSADSEYVEIHLIKAGCAIEPCRVTLGVFRDGDPAALRDAIADALRRRLTSQDAE